MAGVLPAMITWLVVKLAANWQLREDIPEQRKKANYKFSALLAGLLSMIIALVSGLLIRLLSPPYSREVLRKARIFNRCKAFWGSSVVAKNATEPSPKPQASLR